MFMDPDPLQLKYPVYGYPADMRVQADSGVALAQINSLLRSMNLDVDAAERRRVRWILEHRRIREELRRGAAEHRDDAPIDPAWLCLCIDEAIDADTVVINETITHGRQVHSIIERNRVTPGSRFESTGPVAHTGLGQGMGVALGVKLEEPDKTVITLEGDGTFNYNPVLAGFGAAQEHGLPFMTVIFNNGCYAAMKYHARYYPEGHSVTRDTFYGVPCGPSPIYAKLAEAYDGHGETVEDPSEVKPALQRAIQAVRKGRLSLLDVRLSA